MKEGFYSIVLHAHLPYVRHLEEHRLEENWLFEAITESYIPLINAIEQANKAHAVTLSISPPLIEMLADPLLKKRYHLYLKNTEKLLKKEYRFQKENGVSPGLLNFYKEKYARIRSFQKRWQGRVLDAIIQLDKRGLMTCITSSATHTFLPYLLTEQGIRLQVQEGLRCFENHFNYRPTGFWTPECAFNELVDKVLSEEGICYTFVDEHTVSLAKPSPKNGTSSPVLSPNGVALFARHTELSAKVWSSTDGYPGDEWYREFYRDIAYERNWAYIKPYMHPEGIRIDSGLKFNRITGDVEKKAAYEPERAKKRVIEHADHFRQSINEQVDQHGRSSSPPYLMMTPFDAELFGHWWFEGPLWINQLLNDSTDSVHWITPEIYLSQYGHSLETVSVPFSTWGRDGDGSVWLNERNSWVYPIFHQMEEALLTLANRFNNQATEFETNVFNQLAREWMLATSSDWAFIMDGDTSTQYAVSRIKEHETRFHALLNAFISGEATTSRLNEQYAEYPFLPKVQGTAFLNVSRHHNQDVTKLTTRKTILMLSWEYPPVIAGGLSVHVFELAKALAKQHYDIHVVTCHVEGCLPYMKENGIHVHRVQSLQPDARSFNDWIGGLNFAMVRVGVELAKSYRIDLIHAHDWLVAVAAVGLKQKLEIPILVTIHATECGRTKGHLNTRQKLIHSKEQRLMQEAKHLIVCSQAMKKELSHYYKISEQKISIIPNAVSEARSYNYTLPTIDTLQIFSFGRLVPEKGFQTLLTALYELGDSIVMNVKIAGEGPYKTVLEELITDYKLGNRVHLTGFLDDKQCSQALALSQIIVVPSDYEPFGLVALEAMYAGKAVVASKVGGLKELITNGETGMLFEPGDVKGLCEILIHLQENPSLIGRLGRAAADYVTRHFSWEQSAIQTGIEYDRVFQTNKLSAH
ncbi:1,4-alpha-glucan branching protein domain-containing protein [Alkalicoccobacillus porphyridii]|nr:1,4-alpha-glucan branching protein domain-containing protein [Alkalicoccobacillus porphyridii]